ncbi:hypothetical protein TRVL_06072 [Trypanosoma vivax]|nr:hypothetical protein TRVL_06072 [Trypanosoma vivax]
MSPSMPPAAEGFTGIVKMRDQRLPVTTSSSIGENKRVTLRYIVNSQGTVSPPDMRVITRTAPVITYFSASVLILRSRWYFKPSIQQKTGVRQDDTDNALYQGTPSTRIYKCSALNTTTRRQRRKW